MGLDGSRRRHTDVWVVANVLYGRVSSVGGGKVAFPRLDLSADEGERRHGVGLQIRT